MTTVGKDDVRELILVRGLPGSGKTRLALLIASLSVNGHPISINAFATDDFFMVDDEYRFDVTKLSDYHERNQKAVEHQMRNAIEDGAYYNLPVNDLIIVHNTFTRAWEMESYYELAGTYGYKVTSIVVENHHESKSIHNVPDESLSRMKNRFEVML
jgi:tRNA uridine 5-carbamoylmethylation protein Kti12